MARRVHKVRGEIKQLMDDDDDMAEIYFTENQNLLLLYPHSINKVTAELLDGLTSWDALRLHYLSVQLAGHLRFSTKLQKK
ncbi:hypothetical protein P8452_51313 [Trifolium repens]|nr:hypothetical protein P8452_51313 [Trifolium repens]